MDKGPRLAGSAIQQYEGKSTITVVRDAYTDLNVEKGEYPDINVRVALARHISFYYNGGDPKAAVSAINKLLRAVLEQYEDVESVEELLKYPIEIKAIRFEDIRDWAISQEAVAVSL